MIFFAGDVHGTIDIEKIKIFSQDKGKNLTKQDVLIVLGDMGVIWDAQETRRERTLINWYNELPFTVVFVDGNHENHDRLEQLPTAEKWGADVGVVSYSLFHLRRGRVYEIGGKKIFAFGGGFSIDKASRQEYISWWKQELPSMKEMKLGSTWLQEKTDGNIDFVVTHTGPREVVKRITNSFTMKYKDASEEYELQEFLQDVAHNINFKMWVFGHFHFETVLLDGKFRCLYNSIIDENGEFVLEMR